MTAISQIPGIGPFLPYIALVITIGAAVATILPAPVSTSGVWYQMLYRGVQWLALNAGHAKNAEDPQITNKK